ncbi:hypothetical protein SAMN05428997_107136 [Bosea sp. CRIB-10]|uniref:hypothetical protein n=1 Tax=Bosea sp. CRIB-10 TaxID=378404 RepID=UPI0008E78470|nr:hypothetical protein [Bosea sp. CRIB-10]SFC49156.1 hypothetical protein SAMN05428997_107136 [Bosea sp. CRIB-10]
MSGQLLIAPEWLGRSGLWQIDAKGKRKQVDADDIGLSDVLADRLESWMDTFDAIYDEANEAASDFASDAERAAWEAEGTTLAAAIAAELGPDWQITHDFTAWRRTIKA